MPASRAIDYVLVLIRYASLDLKSTMNIDVWVLRNWVNGVILLLLILERLGHD